VTIAFQLGSFTWYKKEVHGCRSVLQLFEHLGMVLDLVLGRFHMQKILSDRSFHRSVEEAAVKASANS
jgi:hypothetical protein